MPDAEVVQPLRDALKQAAAALVAADVPFALAGSYALWVYGAPEPSHDADLAVHADSVDAARKALAEAGFAVEDVPEEWLFKARMSGATVDILHKMNGVPMDADMLAAVERRQVLAVTMPVLNPTDVVTTMLRAMDEHYCDFAAVLPLVRAVRERLDWAQIRQRTQDNDFAVAFLVLADRLGIG